MGLKDTLKFNFEFLAIFGQIWPNFEGLYLLKSSTGAKTLKPKMIKQGLNFLNMPQKVAPGAVLIDFEAIFDRGWKAIFPKIGRKIREFDRCHFTSFF